MLRRSLRTTLLAVMGGMVVLSTVGLGVLSFDAASESLVEAITAKLEAVSQAKEAHAVDLVRQAQADLTRLERFEALEAVLRPAGTATPPPVDPTGEAPLPSTGSPPRHRELTREQLQRVAGAGSFLSIALVDDQGGSWCRPTPRSRAATYRPSRGGPARGRMRRSARSSP